MQALISHQFFAQITMEGNGPSAAQKEQETRDLFQLKYIQLGIVGKKIHIHKWGLSTRLSRWLKNRESPGNYKIHLQEGFPSAPGARLCAACLLVLQLLGRAIQSRGQCAGLFLPAGRTYIRTTQMTDLHHILDHSVWIVSTIWTPPRNNQNQCWKKGEKKNSHFLKSLWHALSKYQPNEYFRRMPILLSFSQSSLSSDNLKLGND